jgi:hypothetical protein
MLNKIVKQLSSPAIVQTNKDYLELLGEPCINRGSDTRSNYGRIHHVKFYTETADIQAHVVVLTDSGVCVLDKYAIPFTLLRLFSDPDNHEMSSAELFLKLTAPHKAITIIDIIPPEIFTESGGNITPLKELFTVIANYRIKGVSVFKLDDVITLQLPVYLANSIVSIYSEEINAALSGEKEPETQLLYHMGDICIHDIELAKLTVLDPADPSPCRVNVFTIPTITSTLDHITITYHTTKTSIKKYTTMEYIS